MAFLKKDPEQELVKAQRKAEKERQQAEIVVAQEAEQQVREAAQAEKEFLATPQGRARTAREAGHRYFEITLPVSDTRRTVFATLTHNMDTRNQDLTGERPTLDEIEREGWALVHVGYVFRTTGMASRDKLLSSGQQTGVTGELVGVYLFRVTEESKS